MKGRILDYNRQESTGIILGNDENRYHFITSEWKNKKNPEPNQIVDFEILGKEAKAIYLEPETIKETNNIGENILFLMVNAGKTIMKGSYILMIIATLYFFLVGYGILSILFGVIAMFNIFIVGFGLKFLGNALLGNRAVPDDKIKKLYKE